MHERAAKLDDVSLPCSVSWVTLPMKTSADDGSLAFVDWPLLLPFDFVPCLIDLHCWAHISSIHLGFPILISLGLVERTLIEASCLTEQGFLSALVGDFSKLPEYWRNMLLDFPGHPAPDYDRTLQSSIGCSLYRILFVVFGDQLFEPIALKIVWI